MTPNARRRFGALVALAFGLFAGLTLLPIPVTGPVGTYSVTSSGSSSALEHSASRFSGFGLALAGFERLGALDMKRSAVLIIGLSLLVPYLIGVVTHVRPADLDVDVADRTVNALAVGVVPGFFADLISNKIGMAGAVLVGWLALSALTLATFAWHPLQRLERKPAPSPDKPSSTKGEAKPRRFADNAKEPAAAAAAIVEKEEPLAKTMTAKGDSKTPKAKAQRKPEAKSAAGEVKGRVWEVDQKMGDKDLLAPPRTRAVDAGEVELDELQERLEGTLAEFKVEGDVAGRTTGPVVTQYGVRLRPGVKMNRLVALSDDLALKMSARSVRVARIPGRDMVGVEVPNPKSRVVLLRELLEDEQWTAEERLLPVTLGLDLEGRPVIADLAKMPHLLIAGATGTGKSVGINAIITSLIYQYQHKEDLRFLMIDPKMVELSMYKELPHLRHPVVTNNKEAARVLKWAVGEMERRYALLEANGARNMSRIQPPGGRGQTAQASCAKEGDAERHLCRGTRHAAACTPAPGVHRGQTSAHRHRGRRARRSHDDGPGRRRDPAGPSGAEGACGGTPPHPRDPASIGERDHRPHQGQFPQPNRVSSGVESR